MIRRRNKFIIFSLLAAVIFAVMAFTFLQAERSTYNNYYALKNGISTVGFAYPYDQVTHNADDSEYWRLEILIEGRLYTSVTDKKYTEAQIRAKNYRINVLYYLANGQPAVYSEKDNPLTEDELEREISGRLITTDADFFADKSKPGFGGTIFLFSLTAASLAIAVLNYVWLQIYKNVDASGTFAYAIFVEATTSFLGSNKRLRVRYRYKNDKDEWLEAISPPSFSPFDVEKLKSIDAIGIKYKGHRSLIVENVKLL